MQDTKNRQSSLPCTDPAISARFEELQRQVLEVSKAAYAESLAMGVAKEQARTVLPEGLTPTRMYMNNNMRNWVHYIKARVDPSTQKEHRLIAEAVANILRTVAPVTMKASGL